MPEPKLTPDRIREALLLLQAVEEVDVAGRYLDIEPWDGGYILAAALPGHDPVSEPEFHREAPTLTEALTELLAAWTTEPWEWPSAEQVRVFRAQFSADEDDVLRVLCGYFAAEPLMVLALLATDAGRNA